MKQCCVNQYFVEESFCEGGGGLSEEVGGGGRGLKFIQHNDMLFLEYEVYLEGVENTFFTYLFCCNMAWQGTRILTLYCIFFDMPPYILSIFKYSRM